MAPSTLLGVVHGAAAVVCLAAGWYLLRSSAPVPGRRWLLLALGSVAVWSAHLAWWCLAGASSAQVLWLPAVGTSMGALLAWSVTVLRPERADTRLLVAVCLVDPVLLLGAELVLGSEAVAVRHDDRIEYGWFYGVHVLLMLVGMLVTASLWVASRADPSPTLRRLCRTVLVGLLAAGVAEVLQLRLLDVVFALVGAVVVVLVLRAEPGDLRPRPPAGAVLDGLGALVLVLDRDDVLVDLNAPARAFFARRDGVVPELGTPAAAILPVPVDDALLGVEVRWSDVDGPADFTCFAARLGASTAPAHGAVVVLRPSVTEPPAGLRPDAVVERRIQQLTARGAATEPLVVLGLRFTSPEDAVRAAQAIEFVVGSLGPLVVERVGDRTLVVLAPAHVEPYLVDVAAGWQPSEGDEAPDEEGAVRSVSLSPVLAGGRVVRHGPASRAGTLVAEVRQELGA